MLHCCKVEYIVVFPAISTKLFEYTRVDINRISSEICLARKKFAYPQLSDNFSELIFIRVDQMQNFWSKAGDSLHRRTTD